MTAMRSTRYRVDHGRTRTNSDTRTASPLTVHTAHRCARERNLMRCRLGRASGECSLRLVQLAARPLSIAHPRIFAVAVAQAGACRGFERAHAAFAGTAYLCRQLIRAADQVRAIDVPAPT